MKKKILLIGPLGEVGGVSVHLYRLASLLKDEFEFYFVNESKNNIERINTLNLRRSNPLRYLWFVLISDRIHIHSGSFFLRICHLIAGTLLKKKIIVTLHSYRQSTIVQDWMIRRLSNTIISVNDEINSKIKSKKSKVLNAFIPPEIDQEPELDSDLLSLLRKKKRSGKFIISGNAFRIVFQNGNDLYGIDQLIGLSKLFKKNSFPGFIIFIVGSMINGKEKFNEYLNITKSQGLSDYLLIVHKSISFVKLIEISDLVVRPTISDGDALTVREAIFLNIPVIASDVVTRPDGAILYKYNDLNDLYTVVTKTLKNPQNHHLKTLSNDEFCKAYKNIYNL